MRQELPAYDIFPYLKEHLAGALSSYGLLEEGSPHFRSVQQLIGDKRITYLNNHLSHPTKQAAWIIVEYGYTDGDYLEDYVSFYSRCHTDYPRKCKRVHFFKSFPALEPYEDANASNLEALRSKILDLILGNVPSEEVEGLRQAYLGFVVVRPLPQTFWGRALLKPFPSESTRERHFDPVHEHSASLFGIKLKVSSLPYQEQDSVVAACATVALWTCLDQAANVFTFSPPKPASITLLGTEARKGRAMPSKGLQVSEICRAIRDSGLEPELFELLEDGGVDSARFWASMVYAYLRAKIPVLLGVKWVEGDQCGWHAIAVCGYAVSADGKTIFQSEHPKDKGLGPKLPGRKIIEFYAHDDQKGPFCHFYLNLPTRSQLQWSKKCRLEEWPIKEGSNVSSWYEPAVIVIPVYHKIRVSYPDAYRLVSIVDNFARELLLPGRRSSEDGVEWDLFLTTNSELKVDVRDRLKGSVVAARVLLAQAPRFLWHAKMFVNSRLTFEMVLDATDSKRAMFVWDCWWHDDLIRRLMHQGFAESAETTQHQNGFVDYLVRTSV